MVTSRRKICKKYFRTWFAPDIVLVVCDWASFTLQTWDQAQGAGSPYGRFQIYAS